MSDNSNKHPNNEDIRLIYKDTYNFYQKWKDISSLDDWVILVREARDLNNKYPYSLCERILLELVEVIEEEFKRRDVP